MTVDSLTLGQKIAYYRKRIKMSQLDLELEINASQGSISRIENDQVNPTKETLFKIGNALSLSTFELADLYALDLNEIPKMIKLASKISSSLNLDEMLDIAVNNIMTELNLSGVLIFLVRGEHLYAVAMDDAPPGREFLLKLLGITNFSLRISLTNETENLCVKCIKDLKSYFSYDAYDFTKDVLNKHITNLMAKATRYKSGIVVPMLLRGSAIGAVLYTKSLKEDFNNEYKSLEAFTEYLATAINNVQEYEKLKVRHQHKN